MSALTVAILFGITLLGFILSGLFCGLETALYRLNPVRLTLAAARGDPQAQRIRREMRKPNRVLTVLLIGTNAAHYLGSYGVAELLHGAGLTEWTLIIVEVALFTPLLFIFAETVPKELFRQHTDVWSYRLSLVLVATRWLLTVTLLLPAVQFLTFGVHMIFGRDEQSIGGARVRISQLIKEGIGSGVLTIAQTTLVDRALALRDQAVGDVMVPWPNVVTIPVHAGREAREAIINNRNFTRFPVVDAAGLVIGVASWLDLALNAEQHTREIMQPLVTLRRQTRVLDALRTIRHERQSLAVVIHARTRKPIGLVTLKDLVEPLTGELAAW